MISTRTGVWKAFWRVPPWHGTAVALASAAVAGAAFMSDLDGER
jgi:hypothetical protein